MWFWLHEWMNRKRKVMYRKKLATLYQLAIYRSGGQREARTNSISKTCNFRYVEWYSERYRNGHSEVNPQTVPPRRGTKPITFPNTLLMKCKTSVRADIIIGTERRIENRTSTFTICSRNGIAR